MIVKDLVVVADKDIEYTIKGLLTRPQALGIRLVTSVGLESCINPAFVKLKAILKKWFSVE